MIQQYLKRQGGGGKNAVLLHNKPSSQILRRLYEKGCTQVRIRSDGSTIFLEPHTQSSQKASSSPTHGGVVSRWWKSLFGPRASSSPTHGEKSTSPPYTKRSKEETDLQTVYHQILSKTIQTLHPTTLLLVDDFWKDRIPLPDGVRYFSEYGNVDHSVVLPGKDTMGLFAKVSIPKNTIMGPYPAFLYRDTSMHPTQRSFHVMMGKRSYIWDIGLDLNHVQSPHYLDFVNSTTFDGGDDFHHKFETLFTRVLKKLGKKPKDFFVPYQKLNSTSINLNPELKQSKKGGWFYKTLRNIHPKEELVINYGFPYLNNLVSNLFPVWKEKLSGTKEEKIAFHRLSLYWWLNPINDDIQKAQEDFVALAELYQDSPDLVEKIHYFARHPKQLKNPYDPIKDWTKRQTKRKNQDDSPPQPPTSLSPTSQPPSKKTKRNEERLKELEPLLSSMIGVPLPKTTTLLTDFNCDEGDIAKLGFTFTYYPKGEYYMIQKIDR